MDLQPAIAGILLSSPFQAIEYYLPIELLLCGFLVFVMEVGWTTVTNFIFVFLLDQHQPLLSSHRSQC